MMVMVVTLPVVTSGNDDGSYSCGNRNCGGDGSNESGSGNGVVTVVLVVIKEQILVLWFY